MKKTYLTKLAIVCFTVVVAFAFMGTGVQAATGSVASTVSIAVPITIVGDSDLVFGTFTAPSTGTHSWTVSAFNGFITDGAEQNSVDLFSGDNSRGVFTISGANNATVTYSVAITNDFGDTGTTLSALTVSPASTQSLGGSGDLTVGVGGTVSLTDAAANGSDALITMTANY